MKTELIYLSENDLFNIIREGDITKKVVIDGKEVELIIGTSEKEVQSNTRPDCEWECNTCPISSEPCELAKVKLTGF